MPNMFDYATGWGGPQQTNYLAQNGGYQIPAAALPYLSAEQQLMLGGNNQQNPLDAFIAGLPEGVDRNDPMAILRAAGAGNPSLSQSIIEKYGIQDAGSMAPIGADRDNNFGDFLMQGAKEVLLPWGIATGAAALFPGTAGAGAGAAVGADGLAPILAGNGSPLATMLPGGTGVAGAGASGVAGAFGGAGLAQLPAAIGSAGAIDAFTGVAGGIGQGPPSPDLNEFVGNTPTGPSQSGQDMTEVLGGAAQQAAGGAPSWLPLLGDLLGGLAGLSATNSAVDAQTDASNKQLEFARESRDKILELNQPFYDASTTALDRMLGMTGMGGTPVDQNALLNADPSYQFRQNESMRMLESGAAAKGGLLSGDFGRTALQLAGSYASQEYSNIYNRIAQVAGYGQGASANNQNALTNYASQSGQAVGDQGFGAASGYINRGNLLMDLAGRLGDFDWSSIGKGR